MNFVLYIVSDESRIGDFQSSVNTRDRRSSDNVFVISLIPLFALRERFIPDEVIVISIRVIASLICSAKMPLYHSKYQQCKDLIDNLDKIRDNKLN